MQSENSHNKKIGAIGDTIGAAFAGMPKRMMGVMDHMDRTIKSMNITAMWENKRRYMEFVGTRSSKYQGPKRKSNRLNISRLAKLKHRKAR